MKQMGGGGLFVETHPFPHVFTPLADSCGGALILGKDNHNGTISFAAFQIPFGFTMKVDSNVIHGDSFFTGPYAIALTETELADSVLFRQDTATRDIQRVNQVPTSGISLPFLAEYHLAKAINHSLIIEFIMRPGASPEHRDFFLRLPVDILYAVRDVSPEAEEVYESRISEIEEAELNEDKKPKIEYHTFFKPPKAHKALSDSPTPKTPTPGGISEE